MGKQLTETAALPAIHGAVLDIPLAALPEGNARDFADLMFDKLALEQRGAMGVRMGISEIIRGQTDTVVVEIGKVEGTKMYRTEIALDDIRSGGNALNTATAMAMVECLMMGDSAVYIHGPLNETHEEIAARDTGLTVRNEALSTEQKAQVPSRMSVIDSAKEMYLKGNPDAQGLGFLMERGILVPAQNGDLILSSCINSPLFWKQIETYLRENPSATLYFQPGSVHLKKLVENEKYLPQSVINSGRLVVILNVGEINGFAENLESHEMPMEKMSKLEINRSDRLVEKKPDIGEGMQHVLTAMRLAQRGLRKVIITNGPGNIISLEKRGDVEHIHTTLPEERTIAEATLKELGIEKPSDEVLTTGCGDTFTGALISLMKLYPHADRNTVMEVASMFSAVQTHNPKSNMGNLNLEPLKTFVKSKLGEPNPDARGQAA